VPLVLAALLALLPAPVALAGPAASTAAPLPTVDPAAPTPTAPLPGGPPTGSAPDGSTVGGAQLDTRGVVVSPGAPAPPADVTAPGWLVADLGTGQVLGARDPHGRYYPASTLKTLTLLTLLDRLPPDQVVTATEQDQNMEGTRVGLVAGGTYPVQLLFQALMLGSGNDVANALARAAGGVPATLEAMNATARQLGADDTVAGTPSGLDVAGQSSSPYDLALIFRALLADPRAAQILTTPRIEIPPEAGKPGFELNSQNTLLRVYPGDVGGKDGFTNAARHTYVTAADRSGRRLVVTLMGAERRPVAEIVQVARLLDWGFSVPPTDPGVGRLVAPGEVPQTLPATSPVNPNPNPNPTPTPTPTATPTGAGAATSRALAPAAAAGTRPRSRSSAGGPASWVAGGVVVLALVGSAATLLARRAARRRISGAAR
jgi:D-alanyl-D-alanine carboxypeptidase (penicillin-binding protein 5/6)